MKAQDVPELGREMKSTNTRVNRSWMRLLVCGAALACFLPAQSQRSSSTASNSSGATATRIESEVVEVTDAGAEPSVINRSAGKFFLVLKGRAGATVARLGVRFPWIRGRTSDKSDHGFQRDVAAAAWPSVGAAEPAGWRVGREAAIDWQSASQNHHSLRRHPMNSRLLAFVTLFPAMITPCLFGQSKTYSSADLPPTPSQATPGASASIDSIDYYTGSVAIRIPLTTIGGRGHADVMTVPFFQQWSVTESNDADGNNRSFAPEPTQATAVGLAYSPGYLGIRSSSRRPNSCLYTETGGTGSWVGLGPYTTWIVWYRSVGSEVVLVDAQYYGSPQGYGVNNCGNLNTYKANPTNRGRIFKSTDGSNLVFVATDDVMDSFLPRGPQCRRHALLSRRNAVHYQ